MDMENGRSMRRFTVRFASTSYLRLLDLVDLSCFRSLLHRICADFVQTRICALADECSSTRSVGRAPARPISGAEECSAGSGVTCQAMPTTKTLHPHGSGGRAGVWCVSVNSKTDSVALTAGGVD